MATAPSVLDRPVRPERITREPHRFEISDNDRQDIGKRIRDLREDKSMTQNDLGKLMGKSRSAMAQWENGNALPDLGDYRALAYHLGSTPAYIAFGTKAGAGDSTTLPLVVFVVDHLESKGAMSLDPEFHRRLTKMNRKARLKAFALPRDGMIDDLRAGDIVIVDESDRETTSFSGETFLILMRNTAQIAKVAIHPTKEGTRVVTLGTNAPLEISGALPIHGKVVASLKASA